MNKHTVTHPDGKISTRNSQNRTYPFAVEVTMTAASDAAQGRYFANMARKNGVEDSALRLEEAAARREAEGTSRYTVETWCGRRDLAEKALATIQRRLLPGNTARIVAVEARP